ncbi:MAG: BapA/Bap/LapF family large adhesin [Buttiauxella sp.]
MRSISIISKLTGVTNNVETSVVTLNSPSIVELRADRTDIASIVRTNNDMVITLRDGEVITVKNFYAYADQGGSQLVLEDDNGALWWVQDTDSAFHFEHIANIDELMAATGAQSDGGGAIWPWVLGGVAVAGGIALAAGGGGGGGGGGDSSNDNGNGGSGNPAPPTGDNTPPAAPTNLSVAADGKTITGSAEPGSTVTITDGAGQVIGTGTADGNGNFSIPLTNPQINGEELTAHATDPAGNTGPDATVTAPLIPEPVEPVVTSVNDDVEPTTGQVLSGESTNDNTPTIEGYALENSIIRIFDNGQEIGTVVADATGHWSFTPATPLSDGTHDFTATASNIKGESEQSGSYTVTIDTQGPAAPENLDTSADGATVTGFAEAGCTVIISDANGSQLGVGTADATTGAFTITISPAQTAGETLVAVAIDPLGNIGVQAQFTAFDALPPSAPVITSVVDDVEGITGNLTNSQLSNDPRPTINGTGEAGSTVTIFDNGTIPLGTTQVNADGTWSFTPGANLSDGIHILTAISSDAAGNQGGASSDFEVQIDATAPELPSITNAYYDNGTLQTPILADQQTNHDRPSLNGLAEPNTTLTLKDNGVEIGTITVDGSGNWSYTPTAPLGNGSHNLTLTATDEAGNVSQPSAGFAFTIDTIPPDAPVILNADDNAGDLQQSVTSGDVTDDTTPTFHGTGVDGDIINLYNGATLLGTTTVSGGVWSITPTTPLPVGTLNLTATATDPVGNVSDPSANFALTIYTTPLTEPVITGIADDQGAIQTPLTDGSVTDDKTPTFNGTGTAGSTINIYDNGGTTPIGTTTVAQDGSWSITLPELSEAQHSLTIGATDPAGNSVGPSAPILITVDNTPPPAPDITEPVEITGTRVSGTAEAGSTVIIKDAGGVEIGRGVADSSDGSFTIVISPAQTAGGTLTAIAQDPAGNASGETGFTASNSGLPQPPVILLLVDDVDPVSGNVTNGQSTNDALPNVHGTATPNATVNLYVDDNPVPIIIPVGPDGTWTYQYLLPLPEGQHTFSATQTTGGETSGFTADFTVTIDITLPDAPVISNATDDVTPGVGELTGGATTNDSRPTLNGTGEAGTTVTIFDNNNPLGTAVVATNGTWTFTPGSDLPDGPHSFSASATDLAGNVGPVSPGFVINIDATAPVAPLITGAVDDDGTTQTPILSGQSTNDTQPIINGTAEPDSILTITDNGTVLGTIPVDGSGNWSYTPGTPLGEGSHEFTFTATDALGNQSPVSSTFTVTVDTQAPAAPGGLQVSADGLHVTGTAEPGSLITVTDANGVILGTGTADTGGAFDVTPLTTAQTNGEALLVNATDAAGNEGPNTGVLAQDNTDPLAPTDVDINIEGTVVTGNAEPGSTVTVKDSDGDPLGDGKAGDDGSFSVTITPPQTNGETLNVSATDNAGNTGPDAPVVAYDTTAPAVPVISEVIDDTDNPDENLNSGDTTNDDKPTLQGTAEPGSTINIYDNGGTTPIGTVNADPDGNWSFTPGTALGQGLHNLTVTATDADNNTSPAATFTLTVDSVAPLAPTITLVSDDVGTLTGPIANNGVTNDTLPTLNGTGEPGSTVTLTLDGTSDLTTFTVDSSGTWSYTLTTELGEGDHSFTVTASDAAGNVTATSDEFVIKVDTSAPNAPAFSNANDNIGSITTDLGNNSSTDDTQPQLNGTGPVGSTITLYDGAIAIGSFVVGNDGLWNITPTQPLTEGTHALRAVATDAAGNASTDATFTLTVDTTPPPAPSIINAQGVVGEAPATLTSGGSTQNGTPTLSGTGEVGATINIYDNGNPTPIGTVTVPDGGNWTFTPAPALAEGAHSLTAVATDPVGNVGLPSAVFTLTVDTIVPVAPGIPTVTDDQTPGLGTIANGGSTNDTTPTISGTGTAGDTITILDNGAPLGTTTVRADGSWSFTPATELTKPDHSITVIESDAAGNKSAQSGAIEFTLDTEIPDAPTIDFAEDDVGAKTDPLVSNDVTDDNIPVFHGTGVNGDTITLYNGNTVLGTAVVAGGVWTITPTAALPNGTLNITATATDPAGNVSDPTTAFTLTVNNTPLTAPVVTEITDDVGVIQTPLTSGSVTDDTTPTVNGTGTVGSTINIYDNGGTTPIGTTTVDADGNWSITLPTLDENGHSLTIGATDAAGNSVGPSAPILITVDTSVPSAPTIATPLEETGTLISGTAEAGSTVIIRDANGVEIGRGLADGTTGAFTVTISPAQTAGEALTAIAQDTAGNQSLPADIIATSSGIPHPPTIEVLDDITPNTGNLTSGQSTNDNLPTLSGQAADNAIVTLYIDGIPQAPITAGVNGAWSYQFTAPLDDNLHTFAVSQTVGGVTSGISPNFVITVDTTLPTTPTITTVTDDVGSVTGAVSSGQVTNDARPTMTGNGEVGSTITILDNGSSIGTAVVGANGTWTFTPGADLVSGIHPITVTSTDAAGNVSAPSAGYSLNLDTLAPNAPVITTVTDDGTTPGAVTSGVPTNDTTPVFNGTVEPNTTLVISDNGTVVATIPVDATGNWTWTPNPALTEGSHTLTLTTTDLAGNVSPVTTFNAIVDTSAPILPAITLVVDDQTQANTDLPLTSGQSTKDTLPTLSGTSEANAIITLRDGNTIIGTTTANSAGEWSLDPTTALGQGNHNLTVTATDAAGNVSNPSGVFAVVIDSVAPTAPLIVTVTDNTAPNIGPITSGQPTNETRPVITGTGEIGSTITVSDGNQVLGTTTVGAGGTWSFTPGTPLGIGSHNLTVTATDTTGNVSAPSAAFNVLVDLAAPTAPVITTVSDDIGSTIGDLANNQVTDDTRPALSGTAEAGSIVNIYDNGTLIGTVTATGGVWNFTPPAIAPLGTGSHAFTVTATDAAGNVSGVSNTFNIVVDTTAPSAPIVIQAFDDVGPVTGALVSGQTTNDNQPLLSGTAEANSIVSISDNGVFLATVTASPTGTWSYTPPVRPDGNHVFTATSADAAGNVGAVSGTFTLTIDTGTPNTPVLTSVVDDVAGGVFNTPLGNGQVTNDTRPTLNGTAEAGSTLAIFDGATQIGTVTVPVGGNWSFTPTTPLGAGLHTFTITATDAAGNVSTATGGFAITVDATAPNAPVITSIVDDVAGGVFNGSLANNQATNDRLPTLNGTAEANSTVNIYDNGVLYTTVNADANGVWTYTPTAQLSEGTHSFTATATDLAGNISTNSLPAGIVVDVTAPTPPTGLAVNATGTSVTGTAEAGSTVTITNSGGTVLGTATADGTGAFTIAISPAQTNAQILQAFAQDAAGNTGTSASVTAPSTALPGVPVITSVVDDFAAITGNVANGQSTNDATPTINGTADAGATVNVYNNGVLMGTTVAGIGGVWSFTPTGLLSEGSHAFTATATNVNGTGGFSTPATVIVDTIAPLAPTATISGDGTTISGTAEANSTVTITLPGGTTVTTTATAGGTYSLTLPTREIGGEVLSVRATDAAGNSSPTITATAPVLPLAADDNVVNLALTTDAQITTSHVSDYGVLLVGALGNVALVLGNDTAQVSFNIATGGSGNITIDASATGVVLSLLNTLEVAVQKYDSATGTWSTIIDSSMPQFANLLTLGASGVTMNITGLAEGSYRVLSYNTSLLATGSLTNLDVAIVQTSAGTITGGTTQPGNVITDPGPTGSEDTAPAGTVVSSITNAQGVTTPIGAGGADIQGQYGVLHINPNGSYTYTLTNTSATVLGHTENFTYTITQNGVSSSAQLVVTLGNGAAASTVTATDNTAALTYNTDVEAINHGASSQSGFSVVGVGLGQVLNLNVLANMSNPIIFDVDDGSTRTMTLQASVGGVALLSTFDLYIYKFNDVTQQFEQYKVVNTWLTAPLLGGTSGQLTLTLPGGEYLFLLNNASGVTVLTGYTLNILQDHTYAVESTTATTNGNVLADDVAPVNSHITQVNGVSVAASGTTTIVGEYGTLTIDANGNYTYKLNAGLGADSIKTPDSFVYTVTAPNGDTDTASLNVTATPTPVNAIDDVSTAMAISTVQTTANYSDITVGSAVWNAALLASTSKSGSGTFVVGANDVLHNPVLHFTVNSVLSLGGLNVTWNITNEAGTVIRSDSFNGGLLLGGLVNINLSGLDLQAGTYTLNYTGSMGPLGLGQISITPTVTGTTIDLDNYLMQSASTVHGNLYDGTDSSGAIDQLGTVHTLLSITGFNGSTATLDPLTNSSASATIQGHYGTLQIGIDGAYTYTLNSGINPASITTKETFTYSLNDQNGHTDSATLTINMNPQFVSTAQSDVITGSAYGDTLVYDLLNNANATGGNGADTWKNFSLAQGDKIDIHDLLVGWNPASSNIANYLNVTTSGNNTVISIDRDGTGTTHNLTPLVTLENTHVTLDELVQQNHIIT